MEKFIHLFNINKLQIYPSHSDMLQFSQTNLRHAATYFTCSKQTFYNFHCTVKIGCSLCTSHIQNIHAAIFTNTLQTGCNLAYSIQSCCNFHKYTQDWLQLYMFNSDMLQLSQNTQDRLQLQMFKIRHAALSLHT